MTASPSSRPFAEALLVFAASFVGCAALGLVGRVVPFVAENLLALVAALFLYLPVLVLTRQGEALHRFGLTTAGWPRGLVAAGVVALVVFPLFTLGYHVFHGVWLGRPAQWETERLLRWSPALDGFPRELDESAALHVWAEGGELRAAGGGRLRREGPAPTVTLEGDGACAAAAGAVRVASCDEGRVVCTLGPERGCRVSAPAWRRVRVSAPGGEVRVGRYGERAAPPLDARRGFGGWWLFALLQLGVVALPEEVLFRGYLQTRLNERWRPRWRLLGARFGPSLFVTSALFALGHLAIEPAPARLAVFFPSLLFGWLRERTGSVVAPIAVHAASNVLIRVVASFYYAA